MQESVGAFIQYTRSDLDDVVYMVEIRAQLQGTVRLCAKEDIAFKPRSHVGGHYPVTSCVLPSMH